MSGRKRKIRLWQRWAGVAIIATLGVVLASWLLNLMVSLRAAANLPVDAIFVLGGSIQREIYVAKLAKQSPQTPILISSGSKAPCIRLIFQREEAPQERVFLEDCARKTFDNFYYSIPILRNWGARKVKLVTSQTHLPRAQWMAQILLGAQGIWVETEIAKETGVPGNRESVLKTTLDVTRSLIWAVGSQFVRPQCRGTQRLVDVDLERWRKRGFQCEHQGNVEEVRR
ncbi:YdcF family protein [Oscillatoria sp. FACHB-1406]|uniref:YdcF family protein n=1 Tax=Oscillatoria sp. FACHB-1406 TaxID=2692846 RepID=UPI001689F1C0|nr:YdcF family protein [Oscillatoria sp. FACHB-1406]MBD2576786.1 YdcF family protein [Oscillatoria sp. FACHB-1406]